MARKKAATQVDEAIASLSFGEAKERLQTILEDLEGHEVDIDDLADQVKEAASLIRVLNDKLTKTETEVKKVVGELRPSGPEKASDEPATGAAGTSDDSFSDDVPF